MKNIKFTIVALTTFLMPIIAIYALKPEKMGVKLVSIFGLIAMIVAFLFKVSEVKPERDHLEDNENIKSVLKMRKIFFVFLVVGLTVTFIFFKDSFFEFYVVFLLLFYAFIHERSRRVICPKCKTKEHGFFQLTSKVICKNCGIEI